MTRWAVLTGRGFTGPGGGRWNTVPVPMEWRGTSVQVCGQWPLVAGSARPRSGVPLGRDLANQNGTSVCCDPISYFEDGLIANPSALILGKPGLGKSSIAVRILLGLSARGVTPMVPGDLKPDYADVIAGLGGQIIRVGRGLGQINVLDPGAMAEAADTIGGTAGARLRQEATDRALEMVAALIAIVRRQPVTDHEELLLAAALNHLMTHTAPQIPTLPDLATLLEEGPEPLRIATLARGDETVYREVADPVQKSLQAVIRGPLGATFAGQTTTAIPLSSHGVCVDISAIGERDERLTAAVMLAAWADAFGAMEAAAALADAGHAPLRTFLVVLDEMWRALRLGAGLPDRMDAITRINRTLGLGQLMLTHTLADLESMASEADQRKARGFAERAGMVLCAGLPRRELDELSRVVRLSEPEIDMVSSWSTPPSWAPRRGDGGRPATPPGAGKVLIKVGGRAGIPVKVELTDTELRLHDTNSRWHTTSPGVPAGEPAPPAARPGPGTPW